MFDFLNTIDWAGIFTPDTPLIEIFLRGTIMYFGIFLLLRFVAKRETGSLNRSDLLVIVLIADAAQNGMTDDYRSVVDGLLLVAVILMWSYALDWLGFHNAWVQRLVQPAPLPVFREGRLMRRNMRHELLTYDELLNAIHKAGYTDFDEIQEILMEGDGTLSVIPINR